MATKEIAILVKMNINLPEGDTEITRAEQENICNKIYASITDLGATSDEYEGHLAGEFIKGGGYNPELEVNVVPTEFEVKVNVNVRGECQDFAVKFPVDVLIKA